MRTRGDDREGEDEEAAREEIARLQRERAEAKDAEARAKKRRGNESEDDGGSSAKNRDGDVKRAGASTKAGTSKAPLRAYTAPKDFMGPGFDADEGEDLESDEALGFGKSRKIIDRESDYSKRRFKRQLSPGRGAASEVRATTRAQSDFLGLVKYDGIERQNGLTQGFRGFQTTDDGTFDAQGGDEGRSYADRMKEAALDREKDNTLRNIERKQKEEAERAAEEARLAAARADEPAASSRAEKRKRRWDAKPDDSAAGQAPARVSEWESDDTAATGAEWDDATPRGQKFDETPAHPSQWETMESGTKGDAVRATPRQIGRVHV